MSARPIRVLVVDDSPICRALLAEVLEAEHDIVVAGFAEGGEEAHEAARRTKPDLVTMDVHMPGGGGLDALARMMAEQPRPMLVVTSLPTPRDGALVFDAIRRGALDVATKPAGGDAAAARELRDRVRLLAHVPVVRHPAPLPPPPPRPLSALAPHLVAIAASAGGPRALATVLGALPASFAAPIAVVQHLPVGFAEAFARHLSQCTALEVVIAREPRRLAPGEVVLAPDGAHLVVTREGIGPRAGAPVGGHVPSADVLFRSVAEAIGARAIGVVLSGIGRDGADGLLAMRRAGATTFAEDASSAAVFGMPKAAAESGAAMRVLAADAIGQALASLGGRAP